MASELIVQTLKGPTSGANANKILIPSGQTLDIDAWLPPAGTLVGYKFELLNGSYNTISADTNAVADTGMSITYTPTSATNELIITGTIHIYRNAAGHNHIYLFKGSTNLMGGNRTMSGHKAAGGSFHSDSPIFYKEVAGDTSARTYKVYAAKRPGESGNLYMNDGSGYTSYLMVMEVTP